MRHCVLRAQVQRLGQHGHAPVPVGLGHLLGGPVNPRRTIEHRKRVLDQHVEPAPRPYGLGHHVREVLCHRDVGVDGSRSAPPGLDPLDIRRRGGIVEVGDQDLRAFRSQPARCRPPDAQRAAGDNGYLSFKSP
jgi:hypothetical protein